MGSSTKDDFKLGDNNVVWKTEVSKPHYQFCEYNLIVLSKIAWVGHLKGQVFLSKSSCEVVSLM